MTTELMEKSQYQIVGSGTAADVPVSGVAGRAPHPTDICIVGAGYVGLTTAACLAEFGHRVSCVEADERRLAVLNAGGVPIVEPGLDVLLARGRTNGRLRFTADIADGLTEASIVFLCVGTPPGPDGRPDLRQLARAARQAASAARRDLILVVKSTVPPGTCEALHILCADDVPEGVTVRMVSHPEFLRESRAIEDVFNPDRIVVGAAEPETARAIADLYPLGPPIVLCDLRGAELVKYAANTFLAVKISFANEVAGLCERMGADARPVLEGVGLDSRIGPSFLGPGAGFGGSCLPKDVSGFIAVGDGVDYQTPIASAALTVNTRTQERLIEKLEAALGGLAGARITVLGLAFKPGTDDVRDSPAIALIRALDRRGAHVQAYDPVATCAGLPAAIVDDPYDAARGSQAVVVATGWREFADLDPHQLRRALAGRVVLDAVDVLPGDRWREAGFTIYRVGRGIPTELHSVVWQPIEWTLEPAGVAA